MIKIIMEVIRERLRKFIDQSCVFDMIPISSEIVAIVNDLSVDDLIEILEENNSNVCLIINKEKEEVNNIFVIADLIGLLLSFGVENSPLMKE